MQFFANSNECAPSNISPVVLYITERVNTHCKARDSRYSSLTACARECSDIDFFTRACHWTLSSGFMCKCDPWKLDEFRELLINKQPRLLLDVVVINFYRVREGWLTLRIDKVFCADSKYFDTNKVRKISRLPEIWNNASHLFLW